LGVAKRGVKAGAGTAAAADTRRRIVEAALDTLKAEGFAGASARAIARTGGFNQALVFYHFGSVNNLLLAALEETSRRRMARYREILDQGLDLHELVAAAADVYREDLEAGHLTVLAEMVGAGVSSPELGARVARCLQPWVAFTEEAVAEAGAESAITSLVPASDLAYAVVALYLGVELLTHLDGDRARAESLFAAGGRLIALLGGPSGAVGATAGDRR
jgi:AcrR family transcriptional regulator